METKNAPTNRGQIEIHPPTLTRSQGKIKLAVELNYLNKSEQLWYRFPDNYEPFISTTSDPFVIATLYVAMKHNLDILVRGSVTRSLVENSELFQQVWNKWNPEKHHKIQILPTTFVESAPQKNTHVAMLFSGGLDSCYTAWKHTLSNDTVLKQTPQSALFVHGFDIPLEHSHYFNNYYAKAKEITDSIQIDLIPLQFNFRQIVGDWEQSHGTALASCLHLFDNLFSMGLIASSHAYDSLRLPWGSNPLTDPLLSTDRLRIINDGGECTRWEKAEAISDWPIAMKHLRVCYKGKHQDRNCGVCTNCLLTAIAFSAVGQASPPSLNVGTIDQTIAQLYTLPFNPMGVVRMEQMASFAKKRGTRADWIPALETCILFHKKRLNMPHSLGKWMILQKKISHALGRHHPVTSANQSHTNKGIAS